MIMVLAMAALGLSLSPAQAANEADFIKLWQLHSKQPDQHATVIATCRDFAEKNGGDPFVVVAQGIEAWHLVKSGRQDEAVPILESHLSRAAKRTGAGADRLARGWLSRIDLASVKQALQLYYRKEVGYPESIADLEGHPGIPADSKQHLRDRWDRPWNYRLTGFTSVPGFRNQRYSIGCLRLGDTLDATEAADLPYAGNIHIRPTRTVSKGEANGVIEFATWIAGREAGKRFVLGEGSTSGNLLLAYIGEKLIIVCDRNHWKVLPKPR